MSNYYSSMAILIISLVVAFSSLLTSSTSLGNNNNNDNQAIMAELAARRPLPPPAGIKINQVYGKDGEFLVNLTIGDSSPSTIHTVRIDTDSDLVWTNDYCNAAPKLPCSSGLCKSVSTTSCNHETDACKYKYEYAEDDPTGVQVELHTETFTFLGNNVKVPNLGFGCSAPIGKQRAGSLGLGLGLLSLVSQLNANIFAYCLPSYDHPEKTGFLSVGGRFRVVKTHTHRKSVTTSLVPNPPQHPSEYYVALTGISVGRVKLVIDTSEFAVDQKNGSGGVVVDTGSTMTYLKKSVFDKVKAEVENQINVTTTTASPEIGLPLCFIVTSKDFVFPRITFYFEKNKKITFPVGNSYREYTDNSTNQTLSCLAMEPAPTSDNGRSSLGNIQQQNTLVVFDRVKQTVTFQPEVECHKM